MQHDATFTLPPLPSLPLDSLRPDIDHALVHAPAMLLEAPPGTGKSTRVPLWALERLPGRVLLLEPRRVAARMLAAHMAALTGTPLGSLVGLAMRRESRQSAATRLLVVTEGVLTRMISADPALEGVSCVLFDEFHERHLASDTGLALALRCQELLRPDLRVGILSATLDSEALQKLLPAAPVLRAERPGHPVRTIWAPAPAAAPGEILRQLPRHMASVITELMAREPGSLLAFLPGQGEIAATARELEGRLAPDCDIRPLYGRLSPAGQTAALAPCPAGRRKVVLATDVAETSLTIEGVRLVVDSGLQRRPHFDPGRGAPRLVTQTIPLSSAAQRRGRAGRTEPGVCVRLWAETAEQGMAAHARPEILEAELGPLALDLAIWGEAPKDLPFVTQPPGGSWKAAQSLLRSLGALDADGAVTPPGRAMAATGLGPRSAAVLLACSAADLPAAAVLCALLEEEQGHVSGDLVPAVDALLAGSHAPGRAAVLDTAALMMARAGRQGRGGTPLRGEVLARAARRLLADPMTCGRLLLPGWSDRLVLRRGRAKDRDAETGLTRQGSGVLLPPLQSSSRLLLALETLLPDTARTGAGQKLAFASVHLHCMVDEALVLAGRELARERQVTVEESGACRVTLVTRLDALVFDERRAAVEAEDEVAVTTALCAWALEHGLRCLPWSAGVREWLSRAAWAGRAMGGDWPDMSPEGLQSRWRSWLPGLLNGRHDWRQVTTTELGAALRGQLPWQLQNSLDSVAPAAWTSPAGNRHRVDYDLVQPTVAVKLQECFGLRESPGLGDGSVLTLSLLSPGGAVLAVTRDLPFFWKEVYPSVRAQMRGRYPRHPWPEDPLDARPTALTQKALRARGLA